MGMEGKTEGMDWKDAATWQLAIIKNKNGKRGWIGKNKKRQKRKTA